MTPPLESLVDIIGLDRDLVAVATQGASQVSPPGSAREVERWFKGLDPSEHIALLSRVIRGDGSVNVELMRRFHRQAPRPETTRRLRTAGELRAGAEAIAERRREVAREREERQRAKRERDEWMRASDT